MLKIGAWRLKMKTRKVYRPVVVDSHHHERNRIQIRIRTEVKSWIRIRIQNLGFKQGFW
jgi:hypothetical protein